MTEVRIYIPLGTGLSITLMIIACCIALGEYLRRKCKKNRQTHQLCREREMDTIAGQTETEGEGQHKKEAIHHDNTASDWQDEEIPPPSYDESTKPLITA